MNSNTLLEGIRRRIEGLSASRRERLAARLQAAAGTAREPDAGEAPPHLVAYVVGDSSCEIDPAELKGKIADTLAKPAAGGASGDVLNALLGLGYSEKEALIAVKSRPPGIAVAEGIRAALKALAKS